MEPEHDSQVPAAKLLGCISLPIKNNNIGTLSEDYNWLFFGYIGEYNYHFGLYINW